MKLPKSKIAFFDSGIGGLTVLNACVRRLQSGIFYYYGDNAHAPYGNLSEEKILSYTEKAFDVFQELNVNVAVLACNTATAVCAEHLRKAYAFPVIGAEPSVFPAAKRGGRIFVLVTRATYQSERFKLLCARARERYPQAEILPFSCDGLAGAIEKNLFEPNFDFSPHLPKGKPDLVVLGCTHYVYLKNYVENFYGCPCLDGNEGIADRLLSVLHDNFRKIWDGRPPNDFLGVLKPPTTTFFVEKRPFFGKRFKRNKNTNVRSGKIAQTPENAGETQILFLGEEGEKNRQKYEQIFGFLKSGQNFPE